MPILMSIGIPDTLPVIAKMFMPDLLRRNVYGKADIFIMLILMRLFV